MESPAERGPTTRAPLHSSIKVLGIRAPPPAQQVPLDWKGAPTEMPASRDFLNMSSRVPSEGAAPPRPPPSEPLQGRDASSTETPSPISQSHILSMLAILYSSHAILKEEVTMW